jgi:hypothetical protein
MYHQLKVNDSLDSSDNSVAAKSDIINRTDEHFPAHFNDTVLTNVSNIGRDFRDF